MTRKGYNSDWQWKRWTYEVQACIAAVRAGEFEQAEQHLDRAEEIDGQLMLDERWRTSGELQGPPRPTSQ